MYIVIIYTLYHKIRFFRRSKKKFSKIFREYGVILSSVNANTIKIGKITSGKRGIPAPSLADILNNSPFELNGELFRFKSRYPYSFERNRMERKEKNHFCPY